MNVNRNHLNQPVGRNVTDWTPPVFPSHTVHTGRYCRLEPLDAERHGADLFQAFSEDPAGRNWTYLPYGPFASQADFQTWLESCMGSADPQFYAMIPNAAGRPAGLCSFLRIQPSAGSIEVGHLHFAESLKRTVAATEGMYLMMKYAFERGYRRCEWKCDHLNHASCASAQRLGFSFEGTFLNALVYKGRNRDTSWFSIIESEWPELENAFTSWLAAENFDEKGRQIHSLRTLTEPLLRQKIPVL